MGQREIPESNGSSPRSRNAIRGKLLTRITKHPHSGRRLIHGRSLLFLDRLNGIAVTLSILAFSLLPVAGHSQQTSHVFFQPRPKFQAEQNRDKACKIIYLGFVGGTEPSNNSRSGVVEIRDILRRPTFPDVCAKSFTPYFWRSGFHWILSRFPSHPGRLAADELENAPKVVLVGHSLGGWAVLSVARNLNRKGIPVELCVQIDSVGVTDHTVPTNVKAAAIFHANDAMFLLTTKTIELEDPNQTKLVENILVRGAGHWSVTRDPRIKELVMCTVEALGSASGQMSHCPSQSGSKLAISPSALPLTDQ
jgi:hypothetical protein